MIVIQQDTREQKHKHDNLLEDFDKMGIRVVKSKNLVGDYIIAGKGNVSVDIKQNMLEVANNLMHDHQRFANECKLAKDCGIKLYVLIQEDINTEMLVDETYQFPKSRRGNSYTKANTKVLSKIMHTMMLRYGVKFYFTKPEYSGINVARMLGLSLMEIRQNCDSSFKEKLNKYEMEGKNVIHC